MPAPVVVRIANAQGVSESRPQDEINAAIVKPSTFGRVDIWLLSEIAWAELEGLAKRHGLHALHYGERGSAEAGVGILSRRPIAAGAMRVGSARTSEGGGIRMRPLVTGRTFGLKVTAGHAPPARSPRARTAYLTRVRLTSGIVCADFNSTPEFMRRTSTRRYVGIGVLGALVPRRFKVSGPRAVDIGSDHPAVDLKVSR